MNYYQKEQAAEHILNVFDRMSATEVEAIKRKIRRIESRKAENLLLSELSEMHPSISHSLYSLESHLENEYQRELNKQLDTDWL